MRGREKRPQLDGSVSVEINSLLLIRSDHGQVVKKLDFLSEDIDQNERRWFSGKIHRCHRWAPGSIPGRRKFFFFLTIYIFFPFFNISRKREKRSQWCFT